MADEGTKRVRRDKKTILTEKIKDIDEKINSYQSKLDDLKAKKKDLERKLEYENNSETREAEKKKQKEMMALIKKSGLSLEELTELLNKK